MIKFEEKQQINIKIKVIMSILFIIFFAYGLLVNNQLIFITFICLILIIILFTIRFDIIVYDFSFEYKLSPFHKSNRVLSISSIRKIEVVETKRMGVFGFKIKNTPRGQFYYFGGTMIRIQTTDGKAIFIGTKRIKEIKQVLKISD